jgi:outer membrane protein OmpA-like peptidoglycan-associated protein
VWSVFFSSGSATLSTEADNTLSGFLQLYSTLEPGHMVRLYAYTDSDGSDAFNQKLATRRMQGVKNQLLNAGIPAGVIRPNVLGETNPLGDNSTAEGRQVNRRVEVHLQHEVQMRTISGVLKAEKTGKPLEGTVLFRSGNLLDSVRTSKMGRYSATVPAHLPVHVEAYVQGFFFQSAKLPPVTPDNQGRKVPLDLTLQPATKNAKIEIPDLFFKPGQAELLPESLPTLEMLDRFFETNPNLVVEIGGHIHLPGVDPATVKAGNRNYELSVSRARVIYEFLKKKQVPVRQMTYRGYGNQFMLYPNAADDSPEAVKNRRVVLQVMGN